MKRIVFLLLLFTILSLNAQEEKSKGILLTNVQIFNGIDKETIHGDLLIDHNKIAKISNRSLSSDTLENIEIIDGKGKFVMPGLIDAHTHITFEDIDVPLSEVMSQVDWGTLNIIATEAAKRQVLRGFTTIRNMGGNAIPLSRQIDNGTIPGPRIYPSGAFISQSGGHGDFGGVNDVPRTSDNLSYTERMGFTAIADGPDQVLRRTREQLRQGATQIKLMAGGGISSDFDPIDVSQYTEKEFKAAVSAAENFGTYVGVHAYTPDAIQTAIKAGVKTIEHGHLLDEETAKLMAEKGAWLSIQPFMMEEENSYPQGSENAKKRDYVYGKTDTAYGLAKKYNVKTAWGTDLFGGKEKADMENDRLVGLKNWFSPYDILKMVTSNNAEMLRLSGPRNPYQEGPLGELTEGAYADLILMNGNPLEDIDLLADPQNNFLLIIKNGKVYKNTLSNKRFGTEL